MQKIAILIFLSFLVLFSLVSATPLLAQTVLIPYGSSVRYNIFPGYYVEPPVEVFSPSYDDSNWPIGTLPFGNSIGGCVVQTNGIWSVGTTLVMRVWIDVPFGSQHLTVNHRKSHILHAWINGEGWFGSYAAGCPYTQGSSYPIGTYFGGLYFFAFRFTNDSLIDWTYADIQITAEIPVPNQLTTWGRIKSIYRD